MVGKWCCWPRQSVAYLTGIKGRMWQAFLKLGVLCKNIKLQDWHIMSDYIMKKLFYMKIHYRAPLIMQFPKNIYIFAYRSFTTQSSWGSRHWIRKLKDWGMSTSEKSINCGIKSFSRVGSMSYFLCLTY